MLLLYFDAKCNNFGTDREQRTAIPEENMGVHKYEKNNT